ncbi:MAG: hypothetical protein EP329_12790 [Deltaproteobacteria bacterium]|nr:MAG: hypothetical protein EP329_12790 [Deltaproteobacteria bacterium]
MAFDFLKKSLGGKSGAQNVGSPSKGSALKGIDGHAAQEAALAPKGGMAGLGARVKDFFGVADKGKSGAKGGAKKPIDPAMKAKYDAAIGGMTNMIAFANNFIHRIPQYQQDSAQSGDTEAAEKCGPLLQRAGQLDSAYTRVLAAYGRYERTGDDAPLKNALEQAMTIAVAMRIVLTGLRGPGDSLGANGLLLDLFSHKTHGGVMVGPKDAAKGKKMAAPEDKGMATGQLPMGALVSGQAVRVYGGQFVTECDSFRKHVAALG